MGSNIHVVPYKGGWAVKVEGNPKPIMTSPTQAPAIGVGRRIGKINQSELVIHDKGGKIRDKESYGNDPCPAKDTR